MRRVSSTVSGQRGRLRAKGWACVNSEGLGTWYELYVAWAVLFAGRDLASVRRF